MSQPFDNIDALIAKVRAVADVCQDQDGSLPRPMAYRQQLGEFVEAPERSIAVQNAGQPKLEELLLPSQSDELFIERVYQVLLNRAPDNAGREHYRQSVPEVGRLYVLGELLCTDECRQRLGEGLLVVPAFQRLTLPLRLQRRLGRLGRLMQPVVQRFYRFWERSWMPELKRRERLQSLEDRKAGMHHQLYGLLLNIDSEAQRQADALARLRQQLYSQQRQLQGQKNEIQVLAQSRQALAETLHRLLPDTAAAEPLLNKLEALGAHARQAVSQHQLDDYYLAFEAIFRGDEDQVLANLQRYLPQVEQARGIGTRALDLGCGRGEWLQLLIEQGFDAHGVDLNSTMVEYCRAQGLRVAEADLLEVLRAQPEASHALISALHIAEHLPFDVLYAMVHEAQRVLAPGGVLIIETPNPENVLVGSHTFYHDPTHRNPLTPTSISFLLEFHGFTGLEVLRFNPYPESAKVPGNDPLTERVNGHLCGPQDYALVAVRPQPETAQYGRRQKEGVLAEGREV